MNAAFLCDVCQSPEATPFVSDCRDLYHGFPGTFDYVRCSACGLVQLYPVPDKISAFYENYDVHQKKGFLHNVMREGLMAHAYYPCTPALTGKRVLDFGCGEGWFLGRARRTGAVGCGFEIDPNQATQLSAELGLPVHHSWEELEKSAPFDLITMHFVLEHLRETPAIIVRLGGMLAPEGKLYGIVPSIRSWEFKLFGKWWHGLDAPRHLVFLEQSHVTSIASKAGLSMVESREVAIPTSLAGTLASLGRSRFSKGIFNLTIPLSLPFFFIHPKGNWSFLLERTK